MSTSAKALLHRHSLPIAHAAVVAARANPSLPYHGAEHCVRTADRAARLAAWLGLDPRPLLVAGLYHDLNHAGPAWPDLVSVESSVLVWVTDGMRVQRRARYWRTPEGLQDDVVRLIRATRWPHETTDQVDELVLRDADLAETLDPQWLGRLAAETGAPADPAFAANHLRWPEFFEL